MEFDPDTCYHALRTHDPRFDGAFFVGVSSTGIYCRTVCTAKTPKRENCTFYPSAAAAEQAGHRPCLRCRPELAPGNARIDAVSRLAGAALSRIEDGALTEGGVTALAAEMGVSDRHLRRAIQLEFGVSPIALAQTQRLLLAKRLLTDTALPVTDVAFASGFSSLRRFNALFAERYRMRPSDLRRGHAAAHTADTLGFKLAYRPPMEWDAMLRFLSARALRGVEAVEGRTYRRTASFGKHRGWLSVAPSPSGFTLRVDVSPSLAPVLPRTLAAVKRLFDLAAEPCRIAERLSQLSDAKPGLRVPGAFKGFEVAVRAIVGQQISVAGATTLAGRLAATLGEPIETPFADLTRVSPTPRQILSAGADALTAVGITPARARTIVALADTVDRGGIRLKPGGDVEETVARLMAVPGIGEWTAQYIAMRALSWPDAFPHTDLGVRKALHEDDPKRILELAESWRPWRAYATMHLWSSLEEIL
ncbi:MAG TPA: DNA-3-methyladenine glycosylase 2 [Armatimonadota bacterium]|jgi:AraC family transcriptional regulator of adaptative response / DNA-3-methyladenine glycosylase II